jgi:hypothetical protein
MPEETIKRAIAQRAGNSSDPGQIALAVSRSLSLLYDELTLVVGAEAAAALCAHAVHCTRPTVGWTMPPAAAFSDSTFSALRDDLSARTPETALHAGQSLLFALTDHLISLIGWPVTRRMLHAAWSTPDASQTSQENL